MKTGDRLTYRTYKTYRDKLNHMIRKNKNKHYVQYFFDAKNDTRKIWKQINKIIHNGKNKDNTNCIKTSHEIENNSHAIGSNFSNYFTAIPNAQNLVSFSVFLDIAKAFNTVDHRMLLLKP